MKKVNIEMVRRDEITIELNEEYFNAEWFEWWNKYFYNHDTLEEVVEHIAYNIIHNNETEIEGIGIPLRDGERPYWIAEDVGINKNVNVIYNKYNTESEFELLEES